ncbi:2Fe-2S iron-sulfur cluster-binding protein [Mucilaginibacter aquariorum]|jgi:ferredoxin|uniref:(2Fe-2S)-binding protein n=1 Tax=Mucilaginibacter aquariorum TaxID=2967225 RepID=A0ABT1T5H0_9SPHI|nr:2Fe-2S iron-sulfur cluster-binding protein [Mucilaginibacter aquariorum]MCQ6959630.1 (2Fe-2S)-binding protein [Mucilaginibacter aquariorum]
MITFIVEDRDGTQVPIEIPEGINLNLMEVLKGSDYPILATCGGMALCATCRVQVINGAEQLPPPGDAELDILDTLPFVDESSRLSCQLRVNESLEGCLFRIPQED